MRKHPKTFDPLFTNMVAAGEAGGILDTILKRLATYIEKAVKLKGQVKSAMIYPVAVIVIAGAGRRRHSVEGHPDLRAAVRRASAPSCRCRRASSSALSNNLVPYFLPFIVGGVVVGGWAFRALLRDRRRAAASSTARLLKMPILGNILRKIAVARFCRTLATLISSGVPILDGLEITAQDLGQRRSSRTPIMVTRTSIERGETIAAPLQARRRSSRRWWCR